MTNGDRIRQMSNDELAKLIDKGDVCDYCGFEHMSEDCHHKSCKEGIKAYLESEEE